MPLSLDSVFGIHQQALKVRSERSELLASNLANADTPGYKARDIDFRLALSGAQKQQATLTATQSGHITGSSGSGQAVPASYRIPSQPALDGNTVDVQREKAEFAENAVRYQATLNFLNGKISSLRTALRGE